MPQWVHRFGSGMAAVGDRDPEIVGIKGAGLAVASRAGLAVPPGFTLSTAACRAFHANDRALPTEVGAAVESAVRSIEAATGRSFSDPDAGPGRRLTLAVRSSPSGVEKSQGLLPGLMGTVQDIGVRRGREPDARVLRAEALYLRHVAGLDEFDIEEALEEDDPFEALASLHRGGNTVVVPSEPMDRLKAALAQGFAAWETDRARAHRATHRLPEGCAVAMIVQAMASSVVPSISMLGASRTRNADTGERGTRGFWVRGVESVGETAPGAVARLAVRERPDDPEDTLERMHPELMKLVETAGRTLEAELRHPVDIKFAITENPTPNLWVLHASRSPLSARASIRVAVELVSEGIIDEREALLRVEPASIERVMHARVDPTARRERLGLGLSASPGAAAGALVFTSREAIAARDAGRNAILVCTETGPDDIIGLQAASAVVTTRGGRTSHAAVVARGLGRPCVTGAATLRVDQKNRLLLVDERQFEAGEPLTVDGNTGEVLLGAVPLVPPALTGDFAKLMEWADNVRRLRVRANADTPEDAEVARRFGAEGIGLCRTEHMFFDTHRMEPMREMILAETADERHDAIARMLPFQRSDFARLFDLMAGLPVMIRLLDPPLHEFLPKTTAEMNRAAAQLDVSVGELRTRVDALREANPMLGHRGCRIAISYPEIARMQIRAILEAAAEVQSRTGRPVEPEIMVPLVSLRDELDYVKALTDDVAEALVASGSEPVRYTVGTMIELPRAALRAHAIAETAEFFSFGTNDLTQTTFGISRDDASPFLTRYREIGLMENDPFATLDTQGVGELIRLACDKGRAARPDIALSICGEHGGDPASIAFCEEIGLDYVSCSPYRVPIARLAAAQAAIRDR